MDESHDESKFDEANMRGTNKQSNAQPNSTPADPEDEDVPKEDHHTDMTTFYLYNSDGTVTAFPPNDTAFAAPTTSDYWQQAMMWRDWHFRRGQQLLAGYYGSHSGSNVSHTYHRPCMAVQPEKEEVYCGPNEYEPFCATRHFYSPAQDVPQLQDDKKYPHLGPIRESLSLYDMLRYIDPERLNDSLLGPKMDIVSPTGDVFSYRVPKKMLSLFLGRKAMARYIRTLGHQKNKKWAKQELVIPPQSGNSVGLRVLIGWMLKACYRENRGKMLPIRIPNNLFAAISLSRVMTLFGLCRDAYRVEMVVGHNHFARPLYSNEIRTVWNCCLEDSRYIERLVAELKHRLASSPEDRKKMLPDLPEVEEFLEETPHLHARVRGSYHENQSRNGHVMQRNVTTQKEQQDESRGETKPDINRKCTVLRILPAREEDSNRMND